MEPDLGTRIRAARDEADLSREQLAHQLGVTLRTLARWERGETKKIPRKKIALIAKKTHKPLSYFAQEDIAA